MTTTITRDPEVNRLGRRPLRDIVQDLTQVARNEVFNHLRQTGEEPSDRRYKILVLKKLTEVTHQTIQRLEAEDAIRSD